MQTCYHTSRREGARARGRAGFSLVELMITIAVLAIIIAISAPSFTGVFNGNRLTSRANELVASLQSARSEALRLNAPVTVCRSLDGVTCAGSAGSWDQWITVNRDDEVLRLDQVKPPVELTADVHTISFRGDGVARDSAGALLDADFVACIPTTRPSDNQRLISVGLGGRISIQSQSGGGECP